MGEIYASEAIKELIKFLLNNGGPVISGHTKFSVTPEILKEINVILEKLNDDIFVSPLTNADLIDKYTTKNELMFLYDFIKKTPKLKISNTTSSHNFNVDIADFSNLKYLELYKFNVKQVKNVQVLRDRLEMVVCIRSLVNVGDLFLNSDSESNIWSKLKHAVLSRNDIPVFDQSFIYTPWLQYLDISYNHLTDLRPLTCLRNLTYLNASYNHLSVIPILPLYELKTLLLNDNFICNISGISKLRNLQECDLSGNCIAEHVSLLPLADLPSLVSLNVSGNPICHDPMHRCFSCGYLHENALDQYFLLNNRPLAASEKQFIRRCSRRVNKLPNRIPIFSSTSPADDVTNFDDTNHVVVKVKNSRKTRKGKIQDASFDEGEKEEFVSSTPIPSQEVDYKLKEKIESIREEYGVDWLGVALKELMNVESVASTTPSSSATVPISQFFNHESPASITNIIFGRSVKENEPLIEEVINPEEIQIPTETTETTLDINAGETSSLSSEELEPEDGQNEGDLWIVDSISENVETQTILLLTDTELKEKNKSHNQIITKWRIDQIQRYVKISSEPFILTLHFDVAKRKDRTRTYRMEYADAQKLITLIETELNRKTLEGFNQKLLHCMKCGLYFCVEIRLRKSGFIEHESSYECPTCHSRAVIEEDEHAVQPKANATTQPAGPAASNNDQVTQSPSLSSIGSAASLDQNNETAAGAETNADSHESDIEVISNPSQSSIEVLEITGSDNTKTVLKIVDAPAAPDTLSSTNNSNNYILTESSSSGSMTDSVCTSYETNSQLHFRGPHRNSHSTVDEVLPEESNLGSSPQKSISEADTKGFEKKRISVAGVFGGMIQSVGSKLLSSSPQKPSSLTIADFDGVKNFEKHEFSYTDFTSIEPHLKFHLWDKHIPDHEDIVAFLKTDTIIKSSAPNVSFPGFFVLTNKKLYVMRITKEEIGDPILWLTYHDNVLVEKVKRVKSIFFKQGFSLEFEGRSSDSNTQKYLFVLFDQRRTDNFLTFLKDLNTVEIPKLDESFDEDDLAAVLKLDEQPRDLTMSELITIFKNDAEYKKFSFVGFVTTNSGFLIVKGEAEWLLSNSSTKPTVLFEDTMDGLVSAEEKKDSLILQFLDESDSINYWWHIKTVSENSIRQIIEAINKPWSEQYGVDLPFSRRVN